MEMDNIIKDCLAALYRLENDALNSRDGYGYSGGDAETIRRAISQNYSLRHKNDELKAENEDLRAKLDRMKWQPIETAPKDGTEILLALWSGHPEHKTAFCWSINGYYKNGFFYSKDPTVGKLIPPTHWQPITAPEQH